ncbi:strictosidine synthase family protein [Thermohalobaculum sediminis]|uniref:strictosidine synthase family protein n=1 Tax=Thermohalobaculum sediminis TaxID=2939436 RepID=UPI0020C150E2|nr:strictosidine synthase family protein [Limibaculum sediminis]
MNRVVLALSLPLLAVVLTALWLGMPPAAVEARFTAADCRRVEVTAQGIGALVGIEDIALLPDGRAILSADDRHAADGARSGLFVADLARLTGGGPVEALPLAGVAQPLRPHGVAVDASGGWLAYVNRPAPGAAEIVWGRLGPGGFRAEGKLGGEAYCRANDLAFVGTDLAVTMDRGDCGVAIADLVPGSRTGRIVGIRTGAGTAETLHDELSFPNGIVADGLDLLVAETRGARVTDLAGGVISLPGGPDNLTPAPDGWIAAALHPDLLQKALYLWGIAGRAPTRLALIDPPAGTVEVLFDDPEGRLFSGATVAAVSGDAVIAGSALDRGLMVCGAGG